MRNIETETISPKKMAAAAQNINEKNYWLKNLTGDFTKSTFYYDFPAKESHEYAMKTWEFQLTGPLFSSCSQLSNRSDPRMHMILTAGLIVLLTRYTGTNDTVIGIPVYKQESRKELINTVLPIRNQLRQSMTFKELLIQVRQTITLAVEHANYPIELLPEQLNMEYPASRDYPLFDITILLENIHDKEYIRHIRHNLTFSFLGKTDLLQGTVEYNSLLYRQETIQRIVGHYLRVLQQVLVDVNLGLSRVEILSEADKKQLLLEFNPRETDFPRDKTFPVLFQDQVKRTPTKVAVSSPLELNHLFNPTTCFKKNPCVYQSQLEYYYEPGKSPGIPKGKQGKVGFNFLKTPGHNSVLVDENMSKLLDLFNGEDNLQKVFSRMENLSKITFIIYSPENLDMLEITHAFASKPHIFSNMNFNDFIALVRLLYRAHLLEPVGYKPYNRDEEVKKPGPGQFNKKVSYDDFIQLKELLNSDKELSGLSQADVLLLGDSPGMPSTGLLYLAAYLRRNNIKAYCKFYDSAADYPSMKKEIETLLDKIQPKIVAISLKWFLYIARVLDMCQVVKEFSHGSGRAIKVVIGGNTASYYWEHLITHESIDYIIRGDGELPLLKICREEENSNIPNCVFKNKNTGEILHNPITYIKDESDSSDHYLSHLDEMMLFGNTVPFGTFFIYTHLGCRMKCLYCGGCLQAQQQSFNREKVFWRPTRDARKDIIAALPYVSTFQFDFDAPTAKENLLDYCRQLWEGIDLSGHFCIISRVWEFNSPALIELAMNTFKYVYWDIDVSTMSERHRLELAQLGLIKPQPTDREILTFLEYCDAYENTEVRLNLIAGLPYLSPGDMETGEKFLSSLILAHPSFSELHWARLHAQPGAPIIEQAGTYDMHSFATGYDDFLEYSKKNFNTQSPHQRLEHLNYPYVYFNDDSLNSKITLNYSETNQKIQQYKEQRRVNRLAGETLTYRQLDQQSNRLARLLRAGGVTDDTITAVMLPPSPGIILGILAVLKAGGGYLPIDPGYPPERIKYMLEDSQAACIITKPYLHPRFDTGPARPGSINIIDIDDHNIYKEADSPPHHINLPQDMFYTIYTSGTTGKPKGVLLTHENLVNYVNWFIRAAQLTEHDKSILTSSYAFDLGYTSLYPPLLIGGECHIVPRDLYMSPERLLNYIDRNEITYLKVTPSLLKPVVNNPYFSSKKCRTLRLVVVGGEPINLEDIYTAHTRGNNPEVVNHYGPTEATIGCVARYVDFTAFEEYKLIPTIGRPIYNTSVYILGKGLDLLPIGSPGELCISGTGLARGYLNRPELTAEKFCPRRPGGTLFEGTRGLAPLFLKGTAKNHMQSCNHAAMQSPPRHLPHYPITPIPHSPIYRTGDLARWLVDGNIQFLGRIDNQVKIRGFRVEPEEIKNRLLKHGQIKDAFVTVVDMVRGDTDTNLTDEKHLCAYFVPAGPTKPPAETKPKAKQDLPPKKILKTKDLDLDLNEELKQRAERIHYLVMQNYNDRYALSPEEKTRYTRQMLLDQWGIGSQEKLKSTTVFVAGAGGGASPTITQLALAGFGTIIVCDCDHVEMSNLNRQFLHDESRMGMNKALSAQMTVQKLNPYVQVVPITEKLTQENVFELVGDAEIIFDMFDDLESKFILSRCAVAKQIPHVVAAMTELSSYTAVFHTPYTPCYHCIFDSKKYQALTKELQTLDKNYSKKPLHVAASSLFVSTGFAVTEAIKITLGLENPAYNKYFLFNQKGTKRIANTDGYRMMAFAYTDHFRKISLQQGFDWQEGWNNHFLVELDIKPDPHCPLCSEKGQSQLETLKNKITANKNANPTATGKPGESPQSSPAPVSNRGPQTVLLMLEKEMDRQSALPGVLKSGKIAVTITKDPHNDFTPTQLAAILEDSAARLILADKENLNLARETRDKVNTQIPVIPIPHDVPKEPFVMEKDIPLSPDQPAVYSYDFTEPPESEHIQSSTRELRDYLARELPDYMIPTYFIPMEKIPLTPNGKIDRSALPEPGDTKEEGNYLPPRNETEIKLVLIWSEILGLEKEKIGIENNFFQLGGNSLSLIKLVSKIYKEFGVEISITKIFENPVIKEISYNIASTRQAEDPFVLFNPDSNNKLFCFPPGVGFGIAYKNLTEILTEYAFYSFNFIEDEDRLNQYVNIITDIQPTGSYRFFGWSAAGNIIFQVAKVLEDQGYEVSDIILADSFWREEESEEYGEHEREFIRFIEQQLEFMGLEFLKDKVRDTSEKYLKYVLDIETLDTIHANVHLLISEEVRNSPVHVEPYWDKFTTKPMVTYEAFGRHTGLFDPDNIKQNAEIIKGILDKIY